MYNLYAQSNYVIYLIYYIFQQWLGPMFKKKNYFTIHSPMYI